MSNDNKNRVLCRRGAQQLSEEQTQEINGGLATLLSVIRTGGGSDITLDS